MTRAEILDCLTDRPCDYCKFHESGRCERWDCVFEEKPDDCEDAISRQAVHNLMAKLLSDYLHDEDREKIENTDAQIADLPSVTPKQKIGRWIPVSERLPEDSYAVLVWCPERRNIYCANREKNQWCIFGAYNTVSEDVSAWTPLPEPYKGGEGE